MNFYKQLASALEEYGVYCCIENSIAGDKLACLHAHDNDGILDLHTYPFMHFGTPYGMNWKPGYRYLSEIARYLASLTATGASS